MSQTKQVLADGDMTACCDFVYSGNINELTETRGSCAIIIIIMKMTDFCQVVRLTFCATLLFAFCFFKLLVLVVALVVIKHIPHIKSLWNFSDFIKGVYNLDLSYRLS